MAVLGSKISTSPIQSPGKIGPRTSWEPSYSLRASNRPLMTQKSFPCGLPCLMRPPPAGSKSNAPYEAKMARSSSGRLAMMPAAGSELSMNINLKNLHYGKLAPDCRLRVFLIPCMGAHQYLNWAVGCFVSSILAVFPARAHAPHPNKKVRAAPPHRSRPVSHNRSLISKRRKNFI